MDKSGPALWSLNYVVIMTRLSILAGGEGLNLVGGNHIIINAGPPLEPCSGAPGNRPRPPGGADPRRPCPQVAIWALVLEPVSPHDLTVPLSPLMTSLCETEKKINHILRLRYHETMSKIYVNTVICGCRIIGNRCSIFPS